jgi:hypothetical protein
MCPSEAKIVQSLAGPEHGHDMRHAAKSIPQPVSIREDTREIRSLGVVASERLLNIREPRPVLDLKQRWSCTRPRRDVRASRELVVLIGLVDRDRIPMWRELANKPLAHRRVDGIPGTNCGCRSSGINQIEIQPHSECRSNTQVGFDAPDVSCLQPLHMRTGKPGPGGKLGEGQSAPPPFAVYRTAEVPADGTKATIDVFR